MAKASALSHACRILSRLETAEAHELNPHLQTDYRIAWLTVLLASRRIRAPDAEASYRILGLHPAKVWESIVWNRKARLGRFYEEFWGLVDLPPKKPAQSEKFSSSRPADRAA
jgi:hypothetical protein